MIVTSARRARIDEIVAEMDRRGEVIERLEASIARKNEILAMALDVLGIASRELSDTHRLVLRGRRWGQTAIDAIRHEIE